MIDKSIQFDNDEKIRDLIRQRASEGDGQFAIAWMLMQIEATLEVFVTEALEDVTEAIKEVRSTIQRKHGEIHDD